MITGYLFFNVKMKNIEKFNMSFQKEDYRMIYFENSLYN